jgi:hypothetical protein
MNLALLLHTGLRQIDGCKKIFIVHGHKVDKYCSMQELRVGLWCLKPLSTIFQLYPDRQETTPPLQVTDKL